MHNRIPPPIYMLVAGFSMWLLSRTSFDVVVSSGLLDALGAALMTAGALVALLAAWQFRRVRTTIDPLNPSKTSELVTTGVFRFSRNPMYLGMAVVLLGFACRLGSLLSVLVLVCFVVLITWVQIKPEERVLAGLFGRAFEDYRTRVRRWL